MKSFKQLIEQENVALLLNEAEKYMAHTPDETLSDHMELVTYYFQQLVGTHGLEALIDRQLLKLSDESETIANFAKKLFWQAILYHDFGKVNENFQRKLENTTAFPVSKKNGIDSQHSILSAFIYLVHQISYGFKTLQKEDEEIQQKLICFIFALAHNVKRHHSPRLDDLSEEKTFEKFTSEFCQRLEEYLNCYVKSFHPQAVKGLQSLLKNVKYEGLSFEWFSLVRLNFSLLTAADYYATSHYCNKWINHYGEFGILATEQKCRHFSNLQKTQSHNEKLYQSYEKLTAQPLDGYKEKSNVNLNKLRSRMAAEVIQNTRQNSDKKLFYIEAPTGGGKTNMAFIATQELLQENPELNKVYYVFPFTTLVTQTQKAAIETLGLKTNESIELHSRAAWKQKEMQESQKDGLYGHDRLDDIHNQFVNYPYTFLSHVRFFDILKANDKSSIYLMHRLANSVVVIDEVQAYNPELWDKMAYLLKEYAGAFNIRFVIMSATLPKIGTLANADFCYLLPNAIDRFFVNSNFSDRVSFSNELLARKQPTQENRAEYLDWLVNQVHDKSEEYRTKNGQARTIIEFIFKKSATEFAELAEDIFDDYEIYVLSGTILEPRRKTIIAELKSKGNQKKNVLLITTQVVEAGVDIDMDLGFKNLSIIDSEEQLAGRVNRNVNKNDCVVYLFDLDDASVIYGKDRRYKEIRNSLESEYFNILRTKRFDELYDKVKSWLDKTNQENGLAGTRQDYEANGFGQLNFPKIDKEFTLIEHSNTSIFVPLELPVNGKKENVFTEQQLEFLMDLGVSPGEGKLSGHDVFELYKQLVTSQHTAFTEKKRNLKMLQSIMAMYTFSLFSESKLVKEIINGGNREEYGYLYLVSHNEVYDYEKGLKDQNFKEMIFI